MSYEEKVARIGRNLLDDCPRKGTILGVVEKDRRKELNELDDKIDAIRALAPAKFMSVDEVAKLFAARREWWKTTLKDMGIPYYWPVSLDPVNGYIYISEAVEKQLAVATLESYAAPLHYDRLPHVTEGDAVVFTDADGEEFDAEVTNVWTQETINLRCANGNEVASVARKTQGMSGMFFEVK